MDGKIHILHMCILYVSYPQHIVVYEIAPPIELDLLKHTKVWARLEELVVASIPWLTCTDASITSKKIKFQSKINFYLDLWLNYAEFKEAGLGKTKEQNVDFHKKSSCQQCVCLTNFHLTFNFKSKLSHDVFKNKMNVNWHLHFSFRMSPLRHMSRSMCHFNF